MPSTSPRTTAPIESSSRLRARPTRPFSKRSISLTAALGRPTRAMPSPTSSTRPTVVCSTEGEALEDRLQRCSDLIGVDLQISHFRLSLWCEVLGGAVNRWGDRSADMALDLGEAAADAAVDDGVADRGDVPQARRDRPSRERRHPCRSPPGRGGERHLILGEGGGANLGDVSAAGGGQLGDEGPSDGREVTGPTSADDEDTAAVVTSGLPGGGLQRSADGWRPACGGRRGCCATRRWLRGPGRSAGSRRRPPYRPRLAAQRGSGGVGVDGVAHEMVFFRSPLAPTLEM